MRRAFLAACVAGADLVAAAKPGAGLRDAGASDAALPRGFAASAPGRCVAPGPAANSWTHQLLCQTAVGAAMAGAVGKTVGVLLLVLGVVALLAGLGAAGYAYTDQAENEDQVFADPDRTDLNQQLMVGGTVAAGAGLVLLVVGLVAMTVGKDRTVVVQTGGEAAAGGSAPASAVTGGQNEAPAPKQAAQPGGPANGQGKPMAVVGAIVVILLLAGAVVGLVAVGTGDGDSGLFSRDQGPVLLADESLNGTARGTGMAGLGYLNPDPQEEGVQDFVVHEAARRVVVNVSWQPADGTGASELYVMLERQTGSGWQELGTRSASSPIVFEQSDPSLAGATLRVRVFAEGYALEQPFSVHVGSWSK